MKISGIFRTSRVVKEENVQRTGRNGVFNSKYVMFQAATDRPYKQTVTKEDGTVVQERESDFFTFKMSNGLYDTWQKYCNAKKVVDGKEKLVSRRLYLAGHAEKYKATRSETIQANVNGQIVQIAVELPEERTIYIVDEIEFLDANPVNSANAQANGIVAQTVAVAPQTYTQPIASAPIAQPVQAIAPVAQPIAQPVAVAPVAQPVAAPVAPVVAGAVSAEVAPF